jgi:hypothetical protein
MLSRFVGRLSYANVMATVALFAALGGSSYAALNLSRASVGPKQLKTNSVTSPKVKRGSLLVSDFKASQRASLRGPQGPQGLRGEVGPSGRRDEGDQSPKRLPDRSGGQQPDGEGRMQPG